MRFRIYILVGLLTTTQLAACCQTNGDTRSTTTTTATTPPTTAPTTAAPPAPTATATDGADAVNALVPPGLDIVFEESDVAESSIATDIDLRIVAVVPTGWEFSDFIDLEWRPPNGSEPFSPNSSMTIKAMCQGSCAPKDWITVIDDPDSTPFERAFRDDATILTEHELASPAGRTIISYRRGRTYVQTARWDNTVSMFFFCEVELRNNDGDHAALFAAACEQSIPKWFSE